MNWPMVLSHSKVLIKHLLPSCMMHQLPAVEASQGGMEGGQQIRGQDPLEAVSSDLMVEGKTPRRVHRASQGKLDHLRWTMSFVMLHFGGRNPPIGSCRKDQEYTPSMRGSTEVSFNHGALEHLLTGPLGRFFFVTLLSFGKEHGILHFMSLPCILVLQIPLDSVWILLKFFKLHFILFIRIIFDA